jgi:hypothetical protein
MAKFNSARFVKNPINGIENGALLVDNQLFDVEELWYASNCTLFYSEFMDLYPSDMAENALELFEAELLAAIE